MCCKGFWKKSIPFFLAFLLGVLAVNFFVFNEISEKQIISPIKKKLNLPTEITSLSDINKSKKCVPVKTNLSEHKEFYFQDELSIIKMIDKRVELEDHLENNKDLTRKEEKQIRNDIENIRKKVDAFLNRERTLKELSTGRRFVKPVYLIYLEKCFEN